ncbi:MAG: cytochrome c [Chloroflexi bacterium]|nr:cytochrome c [Chloroflexota bacterium]
MRNLIISAILIAAGALLVSCGGGAPTPTPPPAPVPPPAATDTKQLFATNCSVCHGPNRQGAVGLGPALTPTSLAQRSDDEIRNTILKGRPSTAMTGFEGRLSPKEIDDLIQLLKYSPP